MRLRILFADYPGDSMPNAMVVTDNYMEDEWGEIPDYFHEEWNKLEKSQDATLRVGIVEIPDKWVMALFEPPVVQGKPA